jgi:hypothetical protein
MAKIAVTGKGERDGTWAFDVHVEEKGRKYDFAVTLRRGDLERWAPAGTAPERVVRAAFTFLLGNEPVTSIMSRFDCSVIRRYFPSVDSELPGLV